MARVVQSRSILRLQTRTADRNIIGQQVSRKNRLIGGGITIIGICRQGSGIAADDNSSSTAPIIADFRSTRNG